VPSVDTGMPSVNPHLVDEASPSPTSVYRYYDKYGLLLYVGLSGSGYRRNDQHSQGSGFWPYVASQTVDHLPDRAAAHAYERRLIIEHRPPFNVHHNPNHQDARAVYLAFRNSPMPDLPDLLLGDAMRTSTRRMRIPLHIKRRDTDLTFAVELRSSPASATMINALATEKPSRGPRGGYPRPRTIYGNHIGQVTSIRTEQSILVVRATLKAGDYAGAYLQCEEATKSGTYRVTGVVIIPREAAAA
jgi:hypothetical protein